MSTKSFADKFNKVTFNIDTTDYEYVKLSDIYNSKDNGGGDVMHRIDGLFINKSQFGDSPVLINTEHRLLINLPTHLSSVSRDILQDNEAIDFIKSGKAGFVIYEYESHGKKCYSINFVDL